MANDMTLGPFCDVFAVLRRGFELGGKLPAFPPSASELAQSSQLSQPNSYNAGVVAS